MWYKPLNLRYMTVRVFAVLAVGSSTSTNLYARCTYQKEVITLISHNSHCGLRKSTFDFRALEQLKFQYAFAGYQE